MKKKAEARGSVTFKDLAARKNPKGGQNSTPPNKRIGPHG